MDARQYEIAARTYSTISSSAQAKIDQKLVRGFLLKTDMMDLIEYALDTQPGISIGASDSSEPAESALHQTYRFLAGIPTQSRAKDDLMAESSKLRSHRASATQ